MRCWLLGALALLAAALGGCANLADFERGASIAPLPVKFIPQQGNFCGPSSLAMLLAAQGHAHPTQQQIAAMVYLEKLGGSLQVDMQSYLRQQGLLAYVLPNNLPALFAALRARQALIVMQNLSFNFYPRWHYALALGYDAKRDQLILHSGPYANYRLAVNTFARTWRRTDNWALLAIDARNLSTLANAASPWLDAGKLLQAVQAADELALLPTPVASYRQLLALFAKIDASAAVRAAAWSALGKHLYSHQAQRAMPAFYQSVKLAANAHNLNNLADSAMHAGCMSLARAAMRCALDLAADNKVLQQTAAELARAANRDSDTCPSAKICARALPAD